MEVHDLWVPEFVERVQDWQDLIPLAGMLAEVEGASQEPVGVEFRRWRGATVGGCRSAGGAGIRNRQGP